MYAQISKSIHAYDAVTKVHTSKWNNQANIVNVFFNGKQIHGSKGVIPLYEYVFEKIVALGMYDVRAVLYLHI